LTAPDLDVLDAPAAMPEPLRPQSPLAAARLHRRLTVDDAAARAGISPAEATWLEEARVYRFPNTDRALLATLLYATALGIDQREARELAGVPVPPLAAKHPYARRALVVVVAVAAVALLAVALAGLGGGSRGKPAFLPGAPLPPPWRIELRVLNGGGDINYTRQEASKIGALGYHVAYVGRADNFRYRQSAVYFPPGGEAIANRLAHQLGVPMRPLPGGTNPRQLVFIVGPARGPGE
jgi:transcriptional regulator with XRE-family HTH domain